MIAVILAIQLVFAIIGMQLFMGSLGVCTNPAITTKEQCLAARAAELGGGAAAAPDATALATAARRVLKGGNDGEDDWQGLTNWVNPDVGSFDNVGDAMLLLYVMSTADDWQGLMYRMMDATEPGRGPERNDVSAAALFSVIWMLVGCFLALNLFVGVVIDNFNRIEAEMTGSASMTLEQQQWVATIKVIAQTQPPKVARPPSHPIRLKLFDLVNSQGFERLTISVILLNVAVMACHYYGIDDNALHAALYHGATHAITDFFYLEFVLKLVALGVAGYFGEAWNRFDFLLVCTSLLDDFAESFVQAFLPGKLRSRLNPGEEKWSPPEPPHAPVIWFVQPSGALTALLTPTPRHCCQCPR